MGDEVLANCVVLPCSEERSWVVPQCCLGEIVTVPADSEIPPEDLCWRGEVIPVVDFGREGGLPWRDQRTGAGLVAVMLGQRDQACQYFAVALRGSGLAVSEMADDEVEDLAAPSLDYTIAAFRVQDNEYQVPDLLALQRALDNGDLVKH